MKYLDNKGNEITLNEALRLAETEKACSEALEYIRNYPDTWTDHYRAPNWCRWYASNVIGGRWQEAEHVIMRDPAATLWYAEFLRSERCGRSENMM